MAEQSVRLRTHVSELAACLEDLLQQRENVARSAREEEAERLRLAQDLAVLQRRLAHLDASLERKAASQTGTASSLADFVPGLAGAFANPHRPAFPYPCRQEAFDCVIGQSQSALCKLVESSHMLLTLTKRNAAEIAALMPQPAPAATGAAAAAAAATRRALN
ncbi:deflagellation-inducible protein [Chlorella vulgaris]